MSDEVTEQSLNIPVSETLSFLKFDVATKEFVKRVADKHLSGELAYKIIGDDTNSCLVIHDNNDICKGSIFPLGVYGYYKKPQESEQESNNDSTQDQTDGLIYHWSWIWSLPDDHEFRTRFGKDHKELQGLRDSLRKAYNEPENELGNESTTENTDNRNHELNKTLLRIFDNANIFSSDPMLNSYIESVLQEKLVLDTIYNVVVDAENNMFLAFGVKDLVWYDPKPTADIVPDDDDE